MRPPLPRWDSIILPRHRPVHGKRPNAFKRPLSSTGGRGRGKTFSRRICRDARMGLGRVDRAPGSRSQSRIAGRNGSATPRLGVEGDWGRRVGEVAISAAFFPCPSRSLTVCAVELWQVCGRYYCLPVGVARGSPRRFHLDKIGRRLSVLRKAYRRRQSTGTSSGPGAHVVVRQVSLGRRPARDRLAGSCAGGLFRTRSRQTR